MTSSTPLLVCAKAPRAALGAQAREPVLRNSQAAEPALIGTLAIEGPAAVPGATRGLRHAPQSRSMPIVIRVH
jgi:hypothetical protein